MENQNINKNKLQPKSITIQRSPTTNGQRACISDKIKMIKVNQPRVNDTKNNNASVLSRQCIGANWQRNIPKVLAKEVSLKNGKKITKCIAMDCEMVGVGLKAKKSILARVSIVNQMGEILLDKYVRPTEPVTDYRTSVSGIRPTDIATAEDFQSIQKEVSDLLYNKILVGHAVHNDLNVLSLPYNPKFIRDTSTYKPLVNKISKGSTPSLRILARCVLGISIQDGEHNSVEDARAVMQIYNKYSDEWERLMIKNESRKNRV